MKPRVYAILYACHGVLTLLWCPGSSRLHPGPARGGALVKQLRQGATAQQVPQSSSSSKGTPQKTPSKASTTACKQRKAA